MMMPDKNRSQFSEALFGDLNSIIASRVARAFSAEDWIQLQTKILPRIILPPINFGDLDQKLREHVILLARGGWYPYREMTLGTMQLAAEDIAQDKYQDADGKMGKVFEQGYQNIKSHIVAKLPAKRSVVLASSFKAHESGDYLLSVPVFLIQAEGICLDVTNVQLYSKKN